MSDELVPMPKFPKRGSKWSPRTPKKKNKYAKDKDLRVIVRKEISKLAENKRIEGTMQQAAFFQPILYNQNLWHIIPNITQGASQGTRVGNMVRPTKLELRLHIFVNNQSTQYTPAYVDLYIFKYKPQNYFPTAALPGTAMGNFLQAGSTTTAYTGLPLDGLRAVNNDVYTSCYRKRLLLYNPLNGTSVQSSTGSMDPCYTGVIDCTKYIKKTLLYDDSTSYCTNDNLWFAIGSSQLDGVLIPVVQIGSVTFCVDFQYEDV